ncbi:hypothetical protein AQUCO_03400026v1 [Aquilegia coerulea]|nr:hypothetical protein AQUCO_03400026v1 [Aquilegia coerulea]
MHYPTAKAANMVTNFMGSAFLLTIFGGFISDSFISRFWTFMLFGIVELLGLIILAVQASDKSLLPAIGHQPSRGQEALLYLGLYAMATGVGGAKATLEAHGADQLDKSNKQLISSFFNWFFFCLSTGGIISATFMVWVEENKGWQTSFRLNIGLFSVALCIFASVVTLYRNKRPAGSPLTRIAKVLWHTARNWKSSLPFVQTPNGISHKKLKFLDKATINDAVSWEQVEETRTFLCLLPIFASTIMMNCCVAQLTTFSVQQGRVMNRKLGHNFEVPPASLSVIPLVVILSSIFLYEHLAARFMKNTPSKNNIFTPIKRIGLGLLLTSVAMVVAALVEIKRRNALENHVKVSVFWLGGQYLLLGFADMLTLGGMLDFFYSEAPDSMRSMSTALAWCATAMGFYLSSVLVSIANAVSRLGGHQWLGGKDLSTNRLELFYALLCVLNFVFFLNYVYWAKRY